MNWKIAILLFFFLVTAAKFWLAADLALFTDEAFYWQCTLRPAIAYMDLPPMTTLLVGLGNTIAGQTVFGVRFIFLLFGVALPPVIYALARPLTGKPKAFFAAALTLVIPGFAHMGLIAIPDVPLILFSSLFLLGFERATRTDAGFYWLLTGLVGALGLMTHYRFILVPAAGFLYLVLSTRGRSLWRRPGLWWAVILFLPGFLPGLLYNLRTDFQPLRYFLPGRHGSRIQFNEPLEHLAEQMMLITPLLYVALLVVLVSLIRKARKGNDRALLFSLFALVPLGLFLAASPFKSTGPQTMHWPLPGYLALTPFLPGALHAFYRRKPHFLRKAVIIGAPVLGGLVVVMVFLELGGGWMKIRGVRDPFLGWEAASQRAQDYLAQWDEAGLGTDLVVADNYKLGAHLEFRLHPERRVFILDHSKNYEHGRQLQFDIWGIGEVALRRQVGREVLLIVQWSEIAGNHANWRKHLAWFFEPMELLEEMKVENPARPKKPLFFQFYRARVIEKR